MDEVVGCLLITFEISPLLGGLIYWIQSVYTIPEARNRGSFKILYSEVVRLAKADPLGKAVRLYVDVDNKKAMEVYERMGMKKLEESCFDEVDFVFKH